MEQNTDEKDNQSFEGLQFESYESLASFIQEYERKNQQKFYIQHSKSIASMRKSLNRFLESSLKYYEIAYACIHGKERASRGSGIRQTSTLRLGCTSKVKVRVDSSGKRLCIYSANLVHTGHEHSSKVYDHLHQTRHLDMTEEADVETYLSLGANKKRIQHKILVDSGKKTTLKDIHNLNSKLKSKQNDLEEAVDLLAHKYACNVHLLCDDESSFKAIQFCTENMRNTMNAWPEFVSVDGTYKLLNMGCTLFLFLVVDSNGQTEIVNASLISVEDKDTYSWVFNTFKEEMKTDKIMCFMGDKDFVERSVIKEVFPGTPTYLCLFHTLKTFRREINCHKLSISPHERDLSLAYVQKLVYSKNDDDYADIYGRFKESVPSSVVHYFDKNWHGIREEWVVYCMTKCNLKNTTNNRMESINHKIKQVVSKNSTLTDFVDSFFVFLNMHTQERDNKAAQHILKKSTQRFDRHRKDLCSYLHLLTNYGFNYVHRQIQLLEKVRIINENEGVFEVESTKGQLFVTVDSCSCPDFTSMMLPCRHVMAVRNNKNVPLFAADLCHMRWTKKYYLSHQRVGQIGSSIIADPTCTISKKQKVLSLTEKRKSATLVTNSMVNLLALCSNSQYNYRLNLLKQIEYQWKIGEEVSVNKASDSFTNLKPSETLNVVVLEDSETTDTNFIDPVTNVQYVEKSRIFEASFPSNNTKVLNNLQNSNLQLNADLEIYAPSSTRQIVSIDTNQPEEENATITSPNKGIFRDIVLPPKIKKRGRPKGHDLTVIGLKKKGSRKIPKKFISKTKNEQFLYIINTISHLNLKVMPSQNDTLQISEEDLKDPIPDVLFDQAVVLQEMEKYFTPNCWEFLLQKVALKSARNDWTCLCCKQLLDDIPSIVCESCLYWFHLECVGLIRVPELKTWFCLNCFN